MSFPEIKQAVDQIGGAFQEFRKSHEEKHSALLDRVEELEAKPQPS